MAIGKTAGCLILAGAAWASAAQFTVRHEHWRKGCEGVMTIDENGVAFSARKGSGPKDHAWTWSFQDIQQLQLAPRRIHILTYKDSKIRLGADVGYEFTGDIPAGGLYALLRDRMDQRFVAQLEPAGQPLGLPALTLPVKHQARILGSEGALAFTPDSIVYATPAKNQSRTWRYQDIDSISSSGRFQLTIVTLEKGFNFQLKQPITEASYNQLWLEIEKKNGRIQ
ncbi:conserved exported hypothetical protein [Candidatus Sulfopaludibacter sp. SbA4]|nr:conserved exported hypothetical protein [Candidatus Sulfopaludibacter sp. SbA4]